MHVLARMHCTHCFFLQLLRTYTHTCTHKHTLRSLFIYASPAAANHFAHFSTIWRFFLFALPHHNNILPDPSPFKCSFSIHPSRPQHCSQDCEPVLNMQSGFQIRKSIALKKWAMSGKDVAVTGSHIIYS